jgi:hypothetical protein
MVVVSHPTIGNSLQYLDLPLDFDGALPANGKTNTAWVGSLVEATFDSVKEFRISIAGNQYTDFFH